MGSPTPPARGTCSASQVRHPLLGYLRTGGVFGAFTPWGFGVPLVALGTAALQHDPVCSSTSGSRTSWCPRSSPSGRRGWWHGWWPVRDGPHRRGGPVGGQRVGRRRRRRGGTGERWRPRRGGPAHRVRLGPGHGAGSADQAAASGGWPSPPPRPMPRSSPAGAGPSAGSASGSTSTLLVDQAPGSGACPPAVWGADRGRGGRHPRAAWSCCRVSSGRPVGGPAGRQGGTGGRAPGRGDRAGVAPATRSDGAAPAVIGIGAPRSGRGGARWRRTCRTYRSRREQAGGWRAPGPWSGTAWSRPSSWDS